MASLMRLASRGLLSAIQRRGVTPLVLLLNFSGHSAWKSRSTSCLSSSECSSRHAVDGVAADAGQIRHAHVAFAALVDQRQPRDARFVAPEADARFIEKARVDLVDDLQVPRQQLREHRERPAFQRFRHQRVIGVAEGFARDVPGLLPGAARARPPAGASAPPPRSPDACRSAAPRTSRESARAGCSGRA